jgi:hypothetical protein
LTITLAVIATIAIIAILFIWSQVKLNVEKVRAAAEETCATVKAKTDITIAQIEVQKVELNVGVQEKIAVMQTNVEKEKATFSFEGGREERVIKKYEIDTSANSKKYAVDSLLKETAIKIGAQLHEVNLTNEFRQRKLASKENMQVYNLDFKKTKLETQTQLGNKMIDFHRYSVDTEASTMKYLGDLEIEREQLVQTGTSDRLTTEMLAKQEMFMRGLELEDKKLEMEERLTTAKLEYDALQQKELTDQLRIEAENNPWNNLIKTGGKLIEVGAITMTGPVGIVKGALGGMSANAVKGGRAIKAGRDAVQRRDRSTGKSNKYNTGEFDLD